MSKGIDWASAPEGYPIWVESKMSTDPSDWHRLESNGYLRDRQGGRWEPWQVRDGECVPHYKPEWDGEGLPPVGTVCEHKRVHEWQKVEVFAIKPNYNDSQTALFTYENGCWAGSADPSSFRPIRSAEQIATDERNAAIEEMWSIYWKPEPQTAKEALGLLWDAGYRKQVAL